MHVDHSFAYVAPLLPECIFFSRVLLLALFCHTLGYHFLPATRSNTALRSSLEHENNPFPNVLNKKDKAKALVLKLNL
jgi:hypothetical protein